MSASVGVSLDGFIAGRSAGPDNNLGDGDERIHKGFYDIEAWRTRQGESGGEVNADHGPVRSTY